MFKGLSVHPCCGNTLCWSIQPLHYSPLPLYFSPPALFQQFSVHILISSTSQMSCFMVLLMRYHSLFLSLFPWIPQSSSTITYMFYIWVVYDHVCFCVCFSLGYVFHMWEKTCGLCLSEPGLLHLTCPPIVSIYLQTLWLSKTPLCTYTTVLDPFISCRASGFFP
jgi:hypothetical protein